MRYLRLFYTVFLVSIGWAGNVETPFVRGHQVGESILEFLQRETGGEAHLKACRLLANARFRQSRKLELQECKSLIGAVDEGFRWTTPLSTPTYLSATEDGATATFQGGRLVLIKLWFYDKPLTRNGKLQNKRTSYDVLLQNLLDRFGVPLQSSNNVGGIVAPMAISSPDMNWTSAGVHVTLSKPQVLLGQIARLLIVISTTDEYGRLTGDPAFNEDLLQ